ncbi:hypothetical protein Tco_1101139 [Tanacetum coccineum]
MASECINSGPGFNCSKFQDSLEDSQSVSSKEDLDNLFGPLYEEYYATRIPKVSDDSAINTLVTKTLLRHLQFSLKNKKLLKYPFHSFVLEEADSSSTFQDSSNMHEFY